ncbi:ImmA/IrrE family metallo-endopeptidase [Aeromicrobium sp.]|uniref:ImmA/IrrE family metallo-endopeptidase n=1 Tax=Aeromicrobium sp. TaxID=1871063 RepID=UPI00403468BE
MPAKPSPVKPDVLRWAISEDGRPTDSLADALKVEVDDLLAWMEGDAAPTRGQVSKLAQVLQRPRALFFLPAPPTAAGLPASFRSAPGAAQDSTSVKARRKLREARRIQHAVAWAYRDEPPIEMPISSTSDDPSEAAESAREWLGFTAATPASWKDDRDALRAWRTALEERGVLVFVLQIGRDDVRGFSAWDDRAPMIVANLSGVSPAARSFTLAHELGHLFTRKDSACAEPSGELSFDNDLERWCERFGAALLMPANSVTALARARRIEPGAGDINDVKAVMSAFRASARAAALRLIDLGLADRSLYQDVLAVFRPAPPPPPGTPMASDPRPIARLRQYGPDTVRTILTELPPRDALSILRVTVDDVRKIAEEVPGVSGF